MIANHRLKAADCKSASAQCISRGAGGILIMIGLWTRWTAFICSGEMAFAYWMGHGTHAVLPIVNMGELAMIYCFLFLFISSKGPGIFSIDHYLKKRMQ